MLRTARACLPTPAIVTCSTRRFTEAACIKIGVQRNENFYFVSVTGILKFVEIVQVHQLPPQDPGVYAVHHARHVRVFRTTMVANI